MFCKGMNMTRSLGFFYIGLLSESENHQSLFTLQFTLMFK